MEQPDVKERVDIEALMDEATADVSLEGVDGMTLEQVREAMGSEAEGLDDAALLAKLGIEAVAEEAAAAPAAPVEAPEAAPAPIAPPAAAEAAVAAPAAPAAKWEHAWRAKIGGSEVDSLENVSAKDLLAAKLVYNVDGQPVERTLDQVVRISAKVPLMEHRAKELLEQRNAAAGELEQARTELEQARRNARTWERALADPTGELLQQLREKFIEHLAAGEDVPAAARAATPAAPAPAAPAVPPEVAQAGQQIYQQQVLPALVGLAEQYDYQGQELTFAQRQTLLEQLQTEATRLVVAEGRYLTPARLQAILQEELPERLAAVGYAPKAAPVAAAPVVPAAAKAPTVAELRAENQRLRQALSSKAADRLAAAPDAGAGSPAGVGGGDPLSQAKSINDVRNVLQDPNETFGM